MAEKERFFRLRQKVMGAIQAALKEDPIHKSYEGTFEWVISYPDYFNDPKGEKGPDSYILRLHCYVIGPSRHYEWRGKTEAEALNQAEKDIDAWIKEANNND